MKTFNKIMFLIFSSFFAVNCLAVDLKEKNKALLIEFMEEVWNKGHLEDLSRFIQFPYTVYHDPGDPWDGQSLDQETFKKRLIGSHQVLPDQHFILEDVVAEDNKVVISWYFTGKHEGSLPGLPASGKQLRVSGLTIYTFSEGKIIGHWQVIDRLGVMLQIKASDK